ncbi:hypothetical protein E3N88_29509 [Mikania micrantha]|uniref:Uncharacterized protein n=1 Tax=Mikania micrantha TaxID=192012 RepID=A0A5N6MJP2_9ASTR|nr:hypothetical protein E3N88_29509 [Mikania micrantha]
MQTTSKQGLKQDGVGCSLDLQDLHNLPWIALGILIRECFSSRKCQARSCQKLHGRAQVVMAAALPPFGPALASLHGRARFMHVRACTAIHGLALPGCTVMQEGASSCISQHCHAWPSTT